VSAAVKQTLGSSSLAPPWRAPQAAYVHVPFCAHQCWYCDFAVVAGRDEWMGRYVEALERELATPVERAPLRTLFLGGGTPTHLSPPLLDRILTVLRRELPLKPGYEFSVEANPNDLTNEKLALLAAHGVTRVSLGVQSLQTHVLQVLERRHGPDDVTAAVARARPLFRDLSLDLIFGSPGQTLEQWRADLEHAVALGVDHVSTYGLTYEKGTRLWKAQQRGDVMQLDEELERAMYGLAMDLLPAAGYEHYEISNFAMPGHRCRHNEVYWANHAYLGFGLGAARYVDGRREVNARSLDEYLTKCLAGASPLQQSEALSPEDRARETAMLNLRRAEGIHRPTFHEQTGFALDELAGAAVRTNVAAGLLADDGERVSLTREGKFLADGVIQDFLTPP
jgi:oxygen-independent coproporphyrinogen-3 oxidase